VNLLRNLQVNLFEYEGKPFAKGIQAFLYQLVDEISIDKIAAIKIAAKRLENIAEKPSISVQYGKDIYCIPVNPVSLPEILSVELEGKVIRWKIKKEPEYLTPRTTKGQEIIRRMIAKAVSNQQIERGWFVERYRLVYYWSFTLTKQLSTEFMDVFPGFVFRPYVYEDGCCAIMLDPKFKFIPKITLREKVDQLRKGADDQEIAFMFEGSALIDACPLVDCEFRKDPSSNCRLKGGGKRRILISLDFSRRPSRATFDLIEYHRQNKVCPNKGRLADLIKDEPPIALIEAYGLKRHLEFPIERLREELKLDYLDKFGRLFVTKYMQPPMNERWYMTKSFMHYIDDVRIGRLPLLRLVRRFAEAGIEGKPWANYTCFDEVPLQFAHSSQSVEPFAGLENYGPYDFDGKHKRNFKELEITLLNFSHKLRTKDIEDFYSHLVNGFTFRPSFCGIKRLFRLEIPPFSHYMLRHNTYYVNDIRLTDNPHIIIVITPHIGKKVKQYGPLKRKLTSIGIPCQFVLEDNVDPKMPTYAGYLKNLALDIYAKAGGVAWSLSRPVNDQTLFIGLDTITRRNMVFMSLQLFNSLGLWLGGWTIPVNRQEYSAILAEKLRDALREYVRQERNVPKHVVIHKEGEIWSDIELKPLIEAIDTELEPIFDVVRSNCRIVSIKKLGMPRIYDTMTRKDYSVKRGTCIQIDIGTTILATSGTPHRIRGSQMPLTIEVKHPAVDPQALMNTCKEVFQLSLVYGGYSLAVTSKPVTTHFASRASSLASKYEITESHDLWKKAWFV